MGSFTEFQNKIKSLPEYEIYFIIEEFGILLAKIDAATKAHMVPRTLKIQQQVDETDYMTNLAVQETKRFGVDDLHIVDDEVVDSTPKYRQWYRFWKRWRYDMPDDNWQAFAKARKNGEPLGEWLPTTKWSDEENQD